MKDRSVPSLQKVLCVAVCLMLISGTLPDAACPQEDYAPLSAADLESLVAPIALYPDELVAQVLGAATYPEQITEAHEWLQWNSGLEGHVLMQAINEQSWDDAVKAVCMFPSVVNLMSDNLAWASALGEAAAMQQADVMAAVQRMRAKAFEAGNLKTTKEIRVVQQSPDVIVIQPANPQVVYVPSYNPMVVYGTPVVVSGYSSADLAATALISFGAGIAIGSMINNSCCGWGWNGWGMHWGRGNIYYRNNIYVGNPYWRGRPRGYYPGLRPPYYPPRPPRPGYRPPVYPGVRPPTVPPPSTRPPRPVHPIAPLPGGGRPPGGGGRPPAGGGGSRPPFGGRPTIEPVPGPGTTKPARQPRPAPAVPMPAQKDLRGYGTGTSGSKLGAFSPSASDRSASIRGNQSLGNTKPAPRPAPTAKPAAGRAPAPRKN